MFPFGMDPKNFDPSQMDPKVVAELTQLVQQLPYDQIMKMQTLMHNMMAGHTGAMTNELQAFESELPAGFREKMAALMLKNPIQNPSHLTPTIPKDTHSARLTVLEGVRDGHVSPQEALRVLFPGE